MTQKQTLLAHLRELHPSLYFPKSATFDQLWKIHRNAHHRYSTNHYHEGLNLGPEDRPEGWQTGEGVVMKERPGYGM